MKRSRMALITLAAVVLLTVVCICPIPRSVDVELKGAAYTPELQKIQNATLKLEGYWHQYLLGEDVLDATLQINDRKIVFDDRPFYLPEEGLYFSYFLVYEPTQNNYVGVMLAYDKGFSNVVLIDEEGMIYVASIHEGITPKELPKPFLNFLKDHRERTL